MTPSDPSLEAEGFVVPSSKTQFGREILSNQFHVIGLEFFPVGRRWIFGVQVVRVECLYPGKHLTIVIITKVIVLPFPVPSVKGVVPDHVEGGLWQVILHDVEQIFIMTPGHQHILHPTAFLIHAKLGVVCLIHDVRIVLEALLSIDNRGSRLAFNREGVTFMEHIKLLPTKT